MAITAGTYVIRSAMDPTIVLDVEGLSKASGANIELWSDNGGPNQVWDVQRVSSTYCRIVSANSGLLVDSTGNTPVDGKNIIQYAPTGGNNQQWLIQDSGEVAMLNGAPYPLYHVKTRMNTSFCLDASGASSMPGTNVLLWTVKSPAALNQLWLFMPTSIPSSKLMAPTSGGLSTSAASGGKATIAVPSDTAAVFVSWVGTGGSWQARYRTASRATTSAELGEWSQWRCLADGSTENSGWGPVGTVCATDASGGRIRPAEPIPIMLGTENDKIRVQFQARRFEEDFEGGFDAHGTAATFTCDANASATVSLASMAWAPDGLRVSLTPSNGRDDNSYRILVEGITKGWQSFAGISAGGHCLIAPGQLDGIPEDGIEYTVNAIMTTRDGVTAQTSSAVPCAYDGGFGISLSPLLMDVGPSCWTVDLTGFASHRVWVIANGAAHEMRDAADGTTWIAAPQDTAFAVHVLAEDGEGGWGIWHAPMRSASTAGHIFTFEGGTLALPLNVGAPPLLNSSSQANADASFMTGGSFEAVTMGEGRSVAGSLTAIMRHDDHVAELAVDDLTAAGFSWYQGVHGELWRVAVEALDKTHQHDEYATVAIGWRRIDG